MNRTRDFYRTTTQFEDAGAGTGEGTGGAGAGAGAPGTGPTPSVITEDRVRSIVADALKPLKADFTKSISETFSPVSEKLDGFAEILKAFHPQQTTKKEGEGTPDPQMVARLMEQERAAKSLNEQVQRLTKENEEAKLAAERSERHSRIRAALGQFQFVSEDAAETAFNLMERQIRRDSDTGNLIGGPDGQALPFDIYIKETLNSKHAYLLGTKFAGGSGATRGDAKLGNSGVMVGTTEMIRPGMRQEERQAVINQIQHVASQMTR